ncbi:ISPsy26, transposase orfB [Pseudomonas cichorii]|uniref:ISPsy26, transposase orfB n=1 Tax=Pseudomonas cichorii TaxID=36746 RepID=A0A3M4MA58_PSECI|nr:ISPsy26, transposase orfB [Pseudomonas cichorii]
MLYQLLLWYVFRPKRCHGFNNQMSPVEFEKRYAMSLQGV